MLKDRYVWFFVLIGWLVILFGPPTLDRIDYTFNRAPWFEAEIQLLDNNVVAYTQVVHRDLTGYWQAWIDVEGKRTCGGDGIGTYHKTKQTIKAYTLAYFLGAECIVPDVPYRVCADWMHTDKSGFKRMSGPVCSVIIKNTKAAD